MFQLYANHILSFDIKALENSAISLVMEFPQALILFAILLPKSPSSGEFLMWHFVRFVYIFNLTQKVESLGHVKLVIHLVYKERSTSVKQNKKAVTWLFVSQVWVSTWCQRMSKPSVFSIYFFKMWPLLKRGQPRELEGSAVQNISPHRLNANKH